MSPESEALVDAPPAPARRRRTRRFVPVTTRARLWNEGIDEHGLRSDLARRESVYRRLLAFADFCGAAFALVLAVQWLGDDALRWEVMLVLPLVIFVAKVQGLYDRDALLLNKTTLDEAPKLFQAATLYTLLLVLSQAQFVQGALGADQLLGVWGLVFATAVAGRWLARRIARRSLPSERVLVIGGPFETAQVANKLRHNSTVNAAVIGRVSLSTADAEPGTVGSINDLESIVEDLGVHRAVIAPGESTYDQTLDGIRAAKAVGVQVSVLPRLLEVVGSSVEFDQLNGVTVLGVRRFGLTTSSRAIKRVMDMVGAAFGLLLFAPLLGVLALLVKRTSPGPVFFRQRRIGQDGRPFQVIKFRSMIEGAEQVQEELIDRNEAGEGLFKIADDPRVTSIGRFLRRSSLDELPQLINVLRGEMSLVGPRPLVPSEDSQIEGRHRRRLHLKPGMTGHWQVLGSSRIPLREMVTIDYLYVANWSLWGDIKILCRTVPHVLARRGL